MKFPAVMAALCLCAAAANAQTTWPNQREDNYIVRDFRFASPFDAVFSNATRVHSYPDLLAKITDNEKNLPKLLRFNFVRHVHSTGQSASWAGPIDFGRDDAFMGLLVVRDVGSRGVVNAP